MKQWLKTRHAIMFGLNNKMFQVNFFDKSCILLNTEYKTIHFTNKKNETFKDTLNNAMKNSDTELTRRIQYMKEILNSIKQKKDDGSTKGDDHLE
jgi:polo-like kinase 1